MSLVDQVLAALSALRDPEASRRLEAVQFLAQFKRGDVHALLQVAGSLMAHAAEEVVLAGFSLLELLASLSVDAFSCGLVERRPNAITCWCAGQGPVAGAARRREGSSISDRLPPCGRGWAEGWHWDVEGGGEMGEAKASDLTMFSSMLTYL